jgi:hypothetical protein
MKKGKGKKRKGDYSPLELVALKNYFDTMLLNADGDGCKDIQQINEARTISNNIGNKLREMANNFR